MRATNNPDDTSEDLFLSSSLLSSSGQSTPQTAVLSDINQACSDASDGKLALPRIKTNFVCRKCKKSFPTRLCYRSHINERSCQASSTCKHRGKSFKFAKDLKRRLGSNKASHSCIKLENADSSTGFAWVCTRSYTRKGISHVSPKSAQLRGPLLQGLQQEPLSMLVRRIALYVTSYRSLIFATVC
jgi:hypothetical protein